MSSLAPGTYLVKQILQPAFDTTQNGSGVTVTIALSGDSIPNIMFGVYQLDTTKFRTYNAVFDMSIPAFEMKYTKKTNTIDPMPNLVTTVENIFYTRKKTKGLAGITLLGYAQPKEFEKTYAWIFYKGSKDLTKLFTFKHDGKAYPIDSLRTTGRKALKLKKAIKASRSKYNNIAFEQGVLFNLNLYASEYGVTPKGFGNLLIDTSTTFVGRQLKGMTLTQLGKLLDSAMTYWQTMGITNDTGYADLNSLIVNIITPINERFAAEYNVSNWYIDTLSVKNKNSYGAKLRGVKTAAEVGIVKYLFTKQSDEESIDFGLDTYVPEEYSLEQNYPNPFNPTTVIRYALYDNSNVTLKVYDVLGREVVTLLDNEVVTAGEHEIEFNAGMISSGVYFYRLTVNDGEFSAMKKMLLLK